MTMPHDPADRSPLAAAAEALLKVARHPLTSPDKPRDETRGEAPAALFDALRAAVASDAAWRARAEAAIEVAEAVWAVDVAWMAYEPSDDPNAGPNASQKRHTAAVARLNAARRRYEETCRAG